MELSMEQKLRKRVVDTFTAMLSNEAKSRNLEKSIYNHSLDKADSHHIPKRWENKIFLQLYLDTFRRLYFTLKKPEVKEKIAAGLFLCKDMAYKSHQLRSSPPWRYLSRHTRTWPPKLLRSRIRLLTWLITFRDATSPKMPSPQPHSQLLPGTSTASRGIKRNW